MYNYALQILTTILQQNIIFNKQYLQIILFYMFITRDETDIRKIKEKAYRQQLVNTIKEKQNNKREEIKSSQQIPENAIVQQNLLAQKQKQLKKEKYLRQLKQQYQQDQRIKARRKEQQKERELKQQQKRKKQLSDLRSKYNEQRLKQQQKNKKKRANIINSVLLDKPQPQKFTLQNTKNQQQKKNSEEITLPKITSNITLTSEKQIKKQKIYQQPEKITFKNMYSNQYNQLKNQLVQQTHKMSNLRQKLQLALSNQQNNISKQNGLNQLKSISRMLQQKYNSYYQIKQKRKIQATYPKYISKSLNNQDDQIQKFYEFNI